MELGEAFTGMLRCRGGIRWNFCGGFCGFLGFLGVRGAIFWHFLVPFSLLRHRSLNFCCNRWIFSLLFLLEGCVGGGALTA